MKIISSSIAALATAFVALTAIPTFAQDAAPDAKKSSESANSLITEARAATKDKRYADSESLMLKLTTAQPELVLPWLELGLAQLGLKKYPDAEADFKIALGIDPASVKSAHSNDFYQQSDAPGVTAPAATRASRNTQGGTVTNAQARTPEIQGIAYSSLGEDYIHLGKVPEAQAAYDKAAAVYPSQAGLYYGNEAVFFFQAGKAPEQLAAADKAIAADPARPRNYYFKAQALTGQATVDPKTSKLVLPPGCAEAYQKYLSLEPTGQFAADAKSVLAASGAGSNTSAKK